jgi:hypothetical protein
MRQIFFGAAILLTAGSAMASSIELVGPSASKDAGSIITESCANCPPLETEARKKDYKVPELQPGTFQSAEIRDVGGEKKIFRTEGWMGGSPIVFVSKATPESMLALTPPAEGIDTTATAAVISGDAKPVAAGLAEQSAPLDVSTFKLRY